MEEKNKKDINREFKLSGSYERGLAGDRYEMKLKNELKQVAQQEKERCPPIK